MTTAHSEVGDYKSAANFEYPTHMLDQVVNSMLLQKTAATRGDGGKTFDKLNFKNK